MHAQLLWPERRYTRGAAAPDLVAKAIVPDYTLGTHTSSIGLTFHEANLFSKRYAGGAFVGKRHAGLARHVHRVERFREGGFATGLKRRRHFCGHRRQDLCLVEAQLQSLIWKCAAVRQSYLRT
jgi:hypothetical protein